MQEFPIDVPRSIKSRGLFGRGISLSLENGDFPIILTILDKKIILENKRTLIDFSNMSLAVSIKYYVTGV